MISTNCDILGVLIVFMSSSLSQTKLSSFMLRSVTPDFISLKHPDEGPRDVLLQSMAPALHGLALEPSDSSGRLMERPRERLSTRRRSE